MKKKKAYVRERAKGKSIRKAAAAVGMPRKTAERVEKDPAIKSAMRRAFEKVGVTEKRIAEKVSDLMDAQKTVSAVSGKDAVAGSVDFVDVPDSVVQLKACELAGKFRGDFIEKHEIGGPGDFSVEIVDYSKAVKAK